MLKLLKKLLYYPVMVQNLFWTAVDQDAFTGSNNNEDCGCPFGKKWHKAYADEIWDMLGPIGKDSKPRLNSIQKIVHLRELVKQLHQIRDHDLGLAQDHDDFPEAQEDYGDKFCDTSKEEHIESANRWNEILGPFA